MLHFSPHPLLYSWDMRCASLTPSTGYRSAVASPQQRASAELMYIGFWGTSGCRRELCRDRVSHTPKEAQKMFFSIAVKKPGEKRS